MSEYLRELLSEFNENLKLNHDLKKKVQLHSENLGALMVTYPSTHGVFE